MGQALIRLTDIALEQYSGQPLKLLTGKEHNIDKFVMMAPI